MNRAERRKASKQQTGAHAKLVEARQRAFKALEDKNYSDALMLCEAGLSLGQDAGLYYVLGRLCLVNNNVAGAIQHYTSSIKADETYAPSLYELGLIAESSDLTQAQQLYQSALMHDKNHPESLERMAVIAIQAGQFEHAWGYRRRNALNNPTDMLEWMRLRYLLELDGFEVNDPPLDAVLLKVLRTENIEQRTVARILYLLLQAKPEFKALHRWLKEHDSPPAHEQLSAFVSEPIMAVMCEHVISHLEGEYVLTKLRHNWLKAAAEETVNDDYITAQWTFLLALSAQCREHEYVWHVSDEERAWLTQIRDRIASADPTLARAWDAVLLGCYDWLYGDEEMIAIVESLKESFPKPLKPYLSDCLDNRRVEAELKSQIETISSIDNDVSKAVQEQYETHPYPTWTKLVLPKPQPMAEALYKGYDVVGMDRAQAPAAPQVLIAGCGTGRHAIYCAKQYTNSKITALDLSRDSLAYAMRMAKKMKINNITFLHGDILDIETLDQQFDVVETVGVLHHMQEPEAGLKALYNVLKPNGFMHLGLYSAAARQHITAMRQQIAERGIGSTPDAMRAWREEVKAAPNEANHQLLIGMLDFFSVSECRDLAFHAQEHCFNMLQIRDMVEPLGLKLAAMEDTGTGIGNQFLNHVNGDRSKVNSFDAWHDFEQANPDIFINMMVMWLAKPLA